MHSCLLLKRLSCDSGESSIVSKMKCAPVQNFQDINLLVVLS